MRINRFHQLTIVAGMTAFFGLFGVLTSTQAAEATAAPTITLLGADPLVVPAGEDYEDPGAIAADSEDGELPVYSTADYFDTTNAGHFAVSYTATDSDGNNVLVSRNVEVQSAEDYYGLPASVERVSKNRVRVTYADGERRRLTLPVSHAKKIKLTASRDCIAFLSGTKRTAMLANPYTGERVSSKRVRRKRDLTTAIKVFDIHPRKDRFDELFVATLNENTGVLKLSAITMHQRDHNLKKRGSVKMGTAKTPQRLRITRKKKTLTVRNGKGKMLMKAVYTRNKSLKKK